MELRIGRFVVEVGLGLLYCRVPGLGEVQWVRGTGWTGDSWRELERLRALNT